MKDTRVASGLDNPPKAPLAFRVGVVGHRPNRLANADLPALEALLGVVLRSVKEAVRTFQVAHADNYAPGEPILRAVTGLAEGTDRVFARQAIQLGYELVCPLPFARDEYEKDFQPGKAVEQGSVEEFRELLGGPHAVTIFELEGSRGIGGDAYWAAGRVVLDQSDLLVSVWDGGAAAGRGGTFETLRRAVDSHVSVLWIDARRPHGWTLGLSGAELAGLDRNLGTNLKQPNPPAGMSLETALSQLVVSLLARPSLAG
jgi:hypothetical protein